MYELLKKYHYCTVCGKQDAYTLAGRILCFECAEKKNKKQREDYHKKREYHSLRKKQLREFRKLNGLCIECGEIAVEGRVRCEKHLALGRHRAEKHKTQKGVISRAISVELGYCEMCCKRFATKGKLCEECYEKAMRGISAANKKIKQLKNEGEYNNSFEHFAFEF